MMRKDQYQPSAEERAKIAVWIEQNPGTLTYVAKQCGCSRPFVSQILRGRRSSRTGLVESALKRLGAPLKSNLASQLPSVFASTLLLLLILPAVVLCQTSPRLVVTPASVTASPGSTVSFSVGYAGTADIAVQWILPIPPALVFNGITSGSGLGTNPLTSKTLYSAQATVTGLVQSSAMVLGLNKAVLPNAELAVIQIKVPVGTAPGPFNIALASILAVKPDATLNTLINPNAPFTINVVPLKGDLNKDGKIDLTDLGILANQGLTGPCTTADMNGDGICNIVDAALLIAAALASLIGG